MAKRVGKGRLVVAADSVDEMVLLQWWPRRMANANEVSEALAQRDAAARESRRGAFWRENIRVREVKQVSYVDRLGKKSVAYAVKDTLDHLYDKGHIDEWQYNAGVVFRDEFERCGYGHVSGVNLTGAGGGGRGVEEIYLRARKSRDYVHNVLEVLGGPGNYMAIVAVQVIGYGVSVRGLTDTEADSAGKKKPRDFWVGILYAALQLMGNDYRRMMQGQRSRGRFEFLGERPDKLTP